MLDRFTVWLTEISDDYSLYVFPLRMRDDGFSWNDPGLIGAIIGASVSVAVALLLLTVTAYLEKGRRMEDRLRREAAGALNTYTKVTRYANIVLSVKKAIDHRYAEIDKNGFKLKNPSQLIGPIAGKSVVPERLRSEEFGFLFNNKDFLIAGEIEDLESSCIQMLTLIEDYNAMQYELQTWLDEMPGVVRRMEGMIASDEVPHARKASLDRRITQMNILIRAVIDVIEQTNPTPLEVIDHFIDAALTAPFGKYFPKIQMY
ncbi:hypothetical protein [Brucella thiophenivorans]|uniref:Uncharacterized protein n=1 Tax=Brucella thiophenivorans TaxID=571255 RepID=A0A256FTM9_9HYPH|nr:hypothetical protein [Brucella thiophenivorans]OYR18217.1 hypothetical protein CEV31_4229 [Brucella thiophenivorans]